ncbi:hypothetical protein KI387_025388, partial [Taxus chinensis]
VDDPSFTFQPPNLHRTVPDWSDLPSVDTDLYPVAADHISRRRSHQSPPILPSRCRSSLQT